MSARRMPSKTRRFTERRPRSGSARRSCHTPRTAPRLGREFVINPPQADASCHCTRTGGLFPAEAQKREARLGMSQ